MTHLIGVLHGQEETFPPALIAEINSRDAGCHAESVKVGGVRPGERPPYRVLVDRLSPRVPFFRSYLKQCALAGAICLNDPLWAASQDRLTVARVARDCGLETAPIVGLPSKEHPQGVTSEDLGNLAYPLPWQDFLDEVGLPAVLRPLDLGSRAQTPVNSLSELWAAYGHSGQSLLCLQSQLQPEGHLLCLTAGNLSLPLGYDPSVGEYRLQAYQDPGLAERASQAALAFSRLSGAALVGVEFALQGGKLIFTDLQILPDLDWWSISEHAFTQVVGAVADLVLERARPEPTRKSGARKAAAVGR